MTARYEQPRRGVRPMRMLAATSACVTLAVSLLTAGAHAGSQPTAQAAERPDKLSSELAAEFNKAGSTDFWVYLEGEADLNAAARMRGWAARGKAVVRELRQVARESQRGLRGELDRRKVRYDAFHVSNAIYVFGGTEQLARSLAQRSDVERVEPARTYQLPEPEPAQAQPAADGVEWGVDAIGADEVWEEFDTSGEGIVVGNIDTGVEWGHPALRDSYRGRNGEVVVHDYHWFDPTSLCGPLTGPCDNHGHGTHTMGTMVGDGGEGARVGVAPGARWIAAKGCEFDSCSERSLLAAGEWMLAPTDQSGNNPRPELRPDVVNNSWGRETPGTTSLWYADLISAWRAAGMFPIFSNGNAGPACDSAGSPGDNAVAYAVGAVDIDGVVADFSSRGPGEGGQAPGCLRRGRVRPAGRTRRAHRCRPGGRHW